MSGEDSDTLFSRWLRVISNLILWGCPMGPANERQVGGTHYKVGGEEHWDRVHRLQLDYFQGQVTKYVERWKLKNGIQDLHKARHFLDKYIELEEKKVAAQVAERDVGVEGSGGAPSREVYERTKGDRSPLPTAPFKPY